MIEEDVETLKEVVSKVIYLLIKKGIFTNEELREVDLEEIIEFKKKHYRREPTTVGKKRKDTSKI